MYAHDLIDVDPNVAYDLVKTNSVITITYDNIPVGALAVDKVTPGLHCELHLLITPPFIKPVLKGKVLDRILYWLFDRLEFRKVKCILMEDNKQAQKWLMRFRFEKKCVLEDETTLDGKPKAMIIYELSRRYFFEKYLPLAGLNPHWRYKPKQPQRVGVSKLTHKLDETGTLDNVIREAETQ